MFMLSLHNTTGVLLKIRDDTMLEGVYGLLTKFGVEKHRYTQLFDEQRCSVRQHTHPSTITTSHFERTPGKLIAAFESYRQGSVVDDMLRAYEPIGECDLVSGKTCHVIGTVENTSQPVGFKISFSVSQADTLSYGGFRSFVLSVKTQLTTDMMSTTFNNKNNNNSESQDSRNQVRHPFTHRGTQ